MMKAMTGFLHCTAHSGFHDRIDRCARSMLLARSPTPDRSQRGPIYPTVGLPAPVQAKPSVLVPRTIASTNGKRCFRPFAIAWVAMRHELRPADFGAINRNRSFGWRCQSSRLTDRYAAESSH
jgi:hypothetical protein